MSRLPTDRDLLDTKADDSRDVAATIPVPQASPAHRPVLADDDRLPNDHAALVDVNPPAAPAPAHHRSVRVAIHETIPAGCGRS
jgi:hypothetical protein